MQLDQIGKYKILEKIGQGAMGEVYRAHDAILNRHVAVKTISAALAGDDQLRKRFQREAQSAARLNHPNIITVYDFGEEHEKIYMAMELLLGYDLKHAIANDLLPSLDQKIDVMAQICDGLSFAHASEIVHRDLKPANIHVQPNGQIKIMDFGLARLGGSEMTRTGMVMGTPHYMSPEQVRGERADARSDIFALGCVFYELLTRTKPFDADSMHAVLFKVMQEEPPPLPEIAPDVPYVIVEIIERAMHKDPAERFQDASALRSALHLAQQAVVEGRGDEPLPATGPQPSRDANQGAEPSSRSDPGSRAPQIGRTDRPAGARSERSTTGHGGTPAGASRSRPGSRPPAPPLPVAPPAASRTILYLAGGALLLAVLTGAWLMARGGGSTAPTAVASTRPGQVDALAQTLAGTQAQTARKRLEAGDYREAVRKAEGALKLDPANADARQVLDRARAVLEKVDAAAAAVSQAAAANDAAQTAGALWSLLAVDPDHALVAEIGPRYESALKGRVPEARALMAEARAAAEKARASHLEGFKGAVALAANADAAAKDGRFLTAVKQYLVARERFLRAHRSVL